jgi:hypothetical protein
MTDNNVPNDPHKNPEIDYERRDFVTGRAFLGLGITLVITLAAMVVIFFMLSGLEEYESMTAPTPLPLLELRPTPPPPRLQPNPIDQSSALNDLLELQAREEAILTGYGWINRDAGIVRIPIERAMELMAEEAPPPTGEPPK